MMRLQHWHRRLQRAPCSMVPDLPPLLYNLQYSQEFGRQVAKFGLQPEQLPQYAALMSSVEQGESSRVGSGQLPANPEGPGVAGV